MRSIIGDIVERLKNPNYAKSYGAEMAKLDFALTLIKVRKQSNLTQSELAQKLQTSQPYIAKLEGGEANPTIGAIGSLLAILGLRLITGTSPLIPEINLPAEPASEEDLTAVPWDANANAITGVRIKGMDCVGHTFQNTRDCFENIEGLPVWREFPPMRTPVAAGE